MKSSLDQFNKDHTGNILSQHFKISRYADSLSLLAGIGEIGVIYNIQEYIGYHSAAIGLFSSQEGEAEIRQSRELNLN